jgi:hypothetical protein
MTFVFNMSWQGLNQCENKILMVIPFLLTTILTTIPSSTFDPQTLSPIMHLHTLKIPLASLKMVFDTSSTITTSDDVATWLQLHGKYSDNSKRMTAL